MLLIGPLEREIRHWDDAPVGSDNSNVSHSPNLLSTSLLATSVPFYRLSTTIDREKMCL